MIRSIRFLVLILILFPGLVFATTAEDVDDLVVGRWLDLTDDAYDSEFGDTGGGGGVWRYSTGIMDTTGNRIISSGGGHNNSGDNAIYAYDLDTFLWSVVWGPTAAGDIATEYAEGLNQDGYMNISGDPASVHSRMTAGYDPITNSVYWSTAGALWCNCSVSKASVNRFDFDGGGAWDAQNDLADNPMGDNTQQIACVDPTTGELWAIAVGVTADDLYQFDPDGDGDGVWTKRRDDVGTESGSGDSYMMAYDGNNDVVLVTGGAGYMSFDVSTPSSVGAPTTSYTSVGGSAIVNEGNNDAGLTFWDQGSTGLFVGYIPSSTRTDIYFIHPTNHFVIKLPATSGGDTPALMTATGRALGGRMGVGTVGDDDVILVVPYEDDTSTFQNYAYKLSENANDSTGPAVSFSNFPTDSGTQVIDLRGITDTTTDDSLILGCQITESDTPPATFTDSWTLDCPSSYDTGGNGNFNLRVWKYDVFGNTGKQNYIVNVNAVTNASNDIATNGVEPTLEPNLDAMGFYWTVVGDANQDATMTVEYGEGNYDSDAMAGFRWRFPETDGSTWNEFSGNILYLDAGTTYWIRMIITDPDGGGDTYTGTFTTKSWPVRPTGGNTYYGSTSGIASGDCAEVAPCTLNYLATKVVAGDIVKMFAGTYTGTIGFGVDGTEADRIVWEPYGDGDVVFDRIIGTGDGHWLKDIKWDMDANSCQPLLGNGADYWVVDGNTFENGKYCGRCASSLCDDEATSHIAIWAASGSDHWFIYDNTITGNRTFDTLTTTAVGDTSTVIVGDVLNDYDDDFFIEDELNRYATITIVDSGHDAEGESQTILDFVASNGTFTMKNPFTAAIGNGVEVAVHLQQNYSGEGIFVDGTGHTIVYNSISGVGDGISLEAENTTVAHNDIFNNHDDGIELDDSYRNMRIIKNRVTNTTNNLISMQDRTNGAPWWIVGNQFVMTREGASKMRIAHPVILYHNTFVFNEDLNEGTTNTTFTRYWIAKNNIFLSYFGVDDNGIWDFGGTSNETWTDLDYNLYDHQGTMAQPWKYSGTRYSTMATWTGASAKAHDDNSYEANGEDIVNNYPSLPTYNPPYANDQLGRVHLTLKVGTDAVDNAVVLNNINDGYVGSAPDIGAYEYGDPDTPIYGPREEEEVPPLPDIVGVSVQ